jgi:hypothetical protein
MLEDVQSFVLLDERERYVLNCPFRMRSNEQRGRLTPVVDAKLLRTWKLAHRLSTPRAAS